MSEIQTPTVINGTSVGVAAFLVLAANSEASGLIVQNLESTANLYLATDSAALNTFVKITPGGYWEFPVLTKPSGLLNGIYGIFDATPALTKSATVTVVQ